MNRLFSVVTMVVLGAVIALTLSVAHAQTVTGSIRGTVTDPTGALVAGAKVAAKNVNTGVSTTTTTDRSGSYNLQSLSIGNYVVTAEPYTS